MFKEEVKNYFQLLQDNICQAIETTDGLGKFQEDKWEHSTGGGGRTRLIQNGSIIEKGGVNFSAVEGPVTEAMSKQMGITANTTFFATGVSIVQHPNSPMVPIIHMNVRYFELSDGTYWFGGGIDLTPHLIDKKQASWFHKQLKAVCDLHGDGLYENYKKQADDYFFIPHRDETRGVGGIFFDHLNESTTEMSKKEIFTFVKAIGETFAPIYCHLMSINKSKNYTESDKNWQLLRRGRYVEFNLVWDRGTKFGLLTGGRTESILMSLPAQANWSYNFVPEEGSPESITLSLLKKEIDWLNQ